MRLTRILLQVKPSEFRYWQRYVERQMRTADGLGLQVHNRLSGYRVIMGKKWYYNEERPWTSEAVMRTKNAGKQQRNVLVEPVKKQTFFEGDVVEVLVGRDKGKKGVIKKIVKERNWCFVEGLHCKYSVRERTATTPGVVEKKEKPLLTTGEVALVDPSDSKGTEIEWRYLEDGTEVRVSKRTGRIVQLPPKVTNVWDDFVDASKYVASKTKDTTDTELKKVTFKPKLCTFEEDILEQHGIKEKKKFQKKFWY